MNETYSQQWYTLVEGKVYLSMGTGHVSVEILHQMDRETLAIMDASESPLVHIILDTRYILSIPPLSEVRKSKYPFHARMGYNITVGAVNNALMRFIIGVATAITQTRSKDVRTLAEAYDFLIEKDPSLPPLHMWTLPSEESAAAS